MPGAGFFVLFEQYLIHSSASQCDSNGINDGRVALYMAFIDGISKDSKEIWNGKEIPNELASIKQQQTNWAEE